MDTNFSGMTARSVAKHGPSDAEEFHEISYNPKSGGFVHSYKTPMMKKPAQTSLDSVDALYSHVTSDNDKWAF